MLLVNGQWLACLAKDLMASSGFEWWPFDGYLGVRVRAYHKVQEDVTNLLIYGAVLLTIAAPSVRRRIVI